MSLWDIPGQQRAAAVLSAATERGDFGHAWAFVGPPDVGQERAARTFAAVANGAADDELALRRFLRGAHPAYREFVPTGTQYRLEDVQDQWLEAANTTLKEGRVKVLRIVAAELMSDRVANAFLKALEEPPPGTVWIIDLADPAEVPDTVLSRCRAVRFAAWTLDALLALATEEGLSGQDAALAARVAMGSPTTLRRLARTDALADYRAHRQWVPRVRAEGPGYALRATAALKDEIKRRRAAIDAEGDETLASLAELYGDEPPRTVIKEVEERYKRLNRAEQSDTIQQALDDVVGWARDVLVVAGRGTGVRNVDAMPELIEAAETFSAGALLTVCDTALHTREAIEVNVKWDLAIEAFLLGAHARSLAG